MRLPVFPLKTVLFPRGLLPLRIFEMRYLDMVRDCLREEKDFGVCLIKAGEEVGAIPVFHHLGTLVRIVDWNQDKNGLLEILVRGERRMQILDHEVASNGLLIGDIKLSPEEPIVPLPEEQKGLSELLRRVIHQLGDPFNLLDDEYDQANWVGGRLTEFLPLPLEFKQQLFELDSPLLRLEKLRAALRRSLI